MLGPERLLAEEDGTARGEPRFVDSPALELAPVEHDLPRWLFERRYGCRVRATQDADGDPRDSLRVQRRPFHVSAHDPVAQERLRRCVDRGRRGSCHEVEHVPGHHRAARGVGAVVDEDHHAVARQVREPQELLVEGKAAERQRLETRSPRLDELAHEVLGHPVEGRGAADEHHPPRLRVKVEGHAHRPLALQHHVGAGDVRRRPHRLDGPSEHVEEDHRDAGEKGLPVSEQELESLGALYHHGVHTLAAVLLQEEVGELLGKASGGPVGEVQVLHV